LPPDYATFTVDPSTNDVSLMVQDNGSFAGQTFSLQTRFILDSYPTISSARILKIAFESTNPVTTLGDESDSLTRSLKLEPETTSKLDSATFGEPVFLPIVDPEPKTTIDPIPETSSELDCPKPKGDPFTKTSQETNLSFLWDPFLYESTPVFLSPFTWTPESPCFYFDSYRVFELPSYEDVTGDFPGFNPFTSELLLYGDATKDNTELKYLLTVHFVHVNDEDDIFSFDVDEFIVSWNDVDDVEISDCSAT
jgi:hypothetical protein